MIYESLIHREGLSCYCFQNPYAFSISSSTGNAATDSSLLWPSNADEGYHPQMVASFFPNGQLSSLIILTQSPPNCLSISCLGGSKSRKRLINCHGAWMLSILLGLPKWKKYWYATLGDLKLCKFINHWMDSTQICYGESLLARCMLPSLSV